MTVTVTFTHEDPVLILEDMARLVGGIRVGGTVSVPAVSEVSSDNEIVLTVDTEKTVNKRGRRPKNVEPTKLPEGPALNVQANPENRVDPESTQDADDEKADSEANKQPQALTHDDVRNAGAEYVKKFEMPATQVDLPLLLTAAAGAETTAIGKLPNDQAVFKKAIDAINAAVASGTRYVKAA